VAVDDALTRITEAALLRHGDDAPLAVGFSGGGDSTALLHVLAQSPQARHRGLRAVHVDHGLHADSARWAEQCRGFCAALDVPLTVLRVRVERDRGEGTEASARRARYAAFAEALAPGESLLLAHHRDDQAETVLLKLLRGAGPAGLAGMREYRPFARGALWRPWLDVPRAGLREYLARHALPFVDDPANADDAYARSYLRREVLPRLAKHWPQAAQSIAHSAALCAAAADHLDAQADAALACLLDDNGSLQAAGWLALDDAVRALALEHWLRRAALPAPTTAQRCELERQVAGSAADQLPRVAWPGAEVRLWRGRLHAMPPLPAAPAGWRREWHGETLPLPLGHLSLSPNAVLDVPLEVRLREGGERIRPAGEAHTRELRDLFQQRGVAPWLRPFWPLLYRDGALLAIPGLCASADGMELFARLGARPEWRRD
jgi:tRNA(Ile)-lysidine synthase